MSTISSLSAAQQVSLTTLDRYLQELELYSTQLKSADDARAALSVPIRMHEIATEVAKISVAKFDALTEKLTNYDKTVAAIKHQYEKIHEQMANNLVMRIRQFVRNDLFLQLNKSSLKSIIKGYELEITDLSKVSSLEKTRCELATLLLSENREKLEKYIKEASSSSSSSSSSSPSSTSSSRSSSSSSSSLSTSTSTDFLKNWVSSNINHETILHELTPPLLKPKAVFTARKVPISLHPFICLAFVEQALLSSVDSIDLNAIIDGGREHFDAVCDKLGDSDDDDDGVIIPKSRLFNKLKPLTVQIDLKNKKDSFLNLFDKVCDQFPDGLPLSIGGVFKTGKKKLIAFTIKYKNVRIDKIHIFNPQGNSKIHTGNHNPYYMRFSKKQDAVDHLVSDYRTLKIRDQLTTITIDLYCQQKQFDADWNTLASLSLKKIDSRQLKEIAKILDNLKSSCSVFVGDEMISMPMGALVYYHLYMIQASETTEKIKDDPHYAKKAFLNQDGCSATAKERAEAIRRALLDVTNSNLT